MSITSDYHLHTPRCKHAKGPLEAYVERACQLGLRQVGFADHNPLPNKLGADARMDESELDDYVADVLRLRDRFRGQIEVLLGIEMDYLEGLESYCEKMIAQYPWDYVLGSIHYLDSECRISSWPRKFTGDATALYRRYFELVRKLARSGLYDVVAHFDVVKRSGRSIPAPLDGDLQHTLEEIARAGLCLEINTSGHRHPELTKPEPYPSFPIIEQAILLKIPLTVNSDAHEPSQVGFKFVEMTGKLHQCGCGSVATFRQRSRTMVEL
jgi:histidinol-phosphatase (PHP family)